MRKRLFNWQGQRFVALGLEGQPGAPLASQARGLFERAASELAPHGLSLDHNTVRTRIFGRTFEARTAGSDARVAALTGQARAAGASFVVPDHFASQADIGLDLLAMAPPPEGGARRVTEHQPVQSFIRHLVWGPMVFLAGMTCEHLPTLAEQYRDVLGRAAGLLAETGCGWRHVVRISFFLHRSQDPQALLAGVAAAAPVALGEAEIELVDGFSRPSKLVEIEITARR
jgi:enamine deaminase RidA (YjgF/YER057c/UK114 family)